MKITQADAVTVFDLLQVIESVIKAAIDEGDEEIALRMEDIRDRAFNLIKRMAEETFKAEAEERYP